MEDTFLELLEVCRQKEFYCMHNNVDDLIESSLNSKLLTINLESQRLDKKKQEVKNIVEHPTKRGTRIVKSLQSFRVKKSSTALNNMSQISPVHAITPVLPTEEPGCSLSMGYEHLSTILETESDEVIKSSAKNLLPIPIFTTFSNPIFDDNDDFTSSDDESLSDEDVPMEDFKVYSNPLFDDDEIYSDKLDPHCFNVESDFVESLSNQDSLFESSSKFDYLEEFSGALMPTSIVDESVLGESMKIEDSDSQREEIEIFTGTDDLLPPGIESDDYDSKRDIHFLEELLANDSILFLENELSNFNHQDDPSFPRPPPEPPDVESFFDLEPNSGEVSPLLLFAESEDIIFDPGISF
nr:hypothetical protein [Tanacetum cinerariifolium]